VAATDAKLEQAVAAGRFNLSLYNRFSNRSDITLPPLRERREDIGVLLVHFLRDQMGESELRASRRAWATTVLESDPVFDGQSRNVSREKSLVVRHESRAAVEGRRRDKKIDIALRDAPSAERGLDVREEPRHVGRHG
jgi:two-component system, NtrC family, nitrogen regulation response regulator GlnG